MRLRLKAAQRISPRPTLRLFTSPGPLSPQTLFVAVASHSSAPRPRTSRSAARRLVACGALSLAMLHRVVRAHRAQTHRAVNAATQSTQRLSPLVAALPAAHTHHAALLPSSSSTSAPCASSFLPARHFASAATPAKKGGKKGTAAAAASDSSTGALLLSGPKYDEWNLIPNQPKPSWEELHQACLTEEQLRFAKRPMPSSEHRAELLPAIYLGAKPIAQHTKEDFGKYFTVGKETLDTMPREIHRTMAQEYMAAGPYHMIRNPGWEIVQAMKTIESGPEGLKKVDQRVFGIRGESGCGKSAALHYTIQYAREQSRANPSKPWLVVATRAEEFTTETKGFIQPSTVKEGVYDQALYTMEFFGNMLKTESGALKLIKLKRARKYEDLTWPEGNPGQTLFDLVTLASQSRELAPRLLYDFTAEIKRSTEIPVLVVLDNLNVFDQVCEFVEPLTYAKMDPRKLALVDAFSWFQNKPPVSLRGWMRERMRARTNRMLDVF
jgi:hypothetical protein